MTYQNSLFFAGGRLLQTVATPGTKGLKVVQNGLTGAWDITVTVSILPVEFQGIIKKYSDFPLDATEDFGKKYPNQVYFEIFDNAGSPTDVALIPGKFSLFMDKQLAGGATGAIQLTLVPAAMGKTDNSKTDNVIVAVEQAAQQ